MLAVDASLVHTDRLGEASLQTGVTGDPSRATAALGQKGVDLIVEKTVTAIRQAMAKPR
jgi:creatinine amidohydrolase/Fe(II)-dependent formamide hydrolase-like protein